MMLSTNFSLEEFTKSSTAVRLGIDNSLPSELLDTATNTIGKLAQPVRDYFNVPVRINSGYRCFKLNTAIGGSKSSQHCKAEAIDTEIVGVDNYELACWIYDNLEYDQLILEYYKIGSPASGWVHASVKLGGDNRGDVFTYTTEHKKLRGLHA